jgi:8-amino-7-oxononanoate synthase
VNAAAGLPKILAGKTVRGPVSARVTIDGREYLNFFGAGYLALSGLAEIRDAVSRVLAQGLPFARQLPAVHGAIDPLFDDLERAGATAMGTQASVYFASGYLIGMVGLRSLEQAFDLVLLDDSAHSNLQDAARMTGLPTFAFAHCDAEALAQVLRNSMRAGQRPVVLTDGVFATSGRVPPLADYVAVLESYKGQLFVDESHALGVVGESGRGAAEYCGVSCRVAAGATLSKAFCVQGAIVGCSQPTANRLRAVPPIGGACAGSPLSAAAALASLGYVERHPELREALHATTQYLRMRLRELGVNAIESPAPIVSFKWGDRADMLALQRCLFDRDIHIHYSNYIGAGPQGILRCAVFRDHSREDIDALIDALRAA